jgi:hypothetical protein
MLFWHPRFAAQLGAHVIGDAREADLEERVRLRSGARACSLLPRARGSSEPDGWAYGRLPLGVSARTLS